MSNYILMPLAGFTAGIISGMGIGGGAVLIPFLCIFGGMDQQAAQGINLLYFIPTGIIAVITHIKNKKINKKMVKSMIFYGLAFSAAGAFIGLRIGPEFLRKMFGIFLLALGAHEIFKKDNAKGDF